MTELDRLLEEESEHAERTPLPADARPTRRGNSRSKVYSIRLNEDEWDAVRRLAEIRGIPPAAMVRGWVVQELKSESHPSLHIVSPEKADPAAVSAVVVRRSA